MTRLGLLVNPIAGVGGPAGLKGSDGTAAEQALAQGYVSPAQSRTVQALRAMGPLEDAFQLYTFSRGMGEDAARAAGFSPIVLGTCGEPTTFQDTRRGAALLADLPVDLLLFSGGDGTARDIAAAVGERIPVLGIPCGVKIHSSVYALTPQRAGELAARYLSGGVPLALGEVLDLDEEAFRRGQVQAQFYGGLLVPKDGAVQHTKSAGYTPGDGGEGLSQAIRREMRPGALCLVGPGSTLYTACKWMGIHGSLLGMDLVRDGCLLQRDCTEHQLYRALEEGEQAQLFVTVIGGQGVLFGRGNQQLSPQILRRIGQENIRVVSTKEKLADLRLRPMTLDTGDPELNRDLAGYYRVLVGPCETVLYPAK